MKSKRIEWVDIAKYICIMCVMCSHLESKTKFLSGIFLPFYLTLFFFCSGYVYKEKENFAIFITKKIKQLFIPWLILSNLNILLSQVVSFNEHGSLRTELIWNFLQIRGKGDGLWFVSALFIAYIPFYFSIHWFHKYRQRNVVLIGGAGLLYILSKIYSSLMNPTLFPWDSANLPWHIEYIFIAMFYMILGYLFKRNFETKFDSYNTKTFRLYIWGIYLCVVYFYNYIPIDNIFIKECILFVQSLLGIYAVISICKIMKSNRYLLYIGENTLLCFAFHGKVYSLLQVVLKKCAGKLYDIILILPVYVINRYIPFVIGRSSVRKFDR